VRCCSHCKDNKERPACFCSLSCFNEHHNKGGSNWLQTAFGDTLEFLPWPAGFNPKKDPISHAAWQEQGNWMTKKEIWEALGIHDEARAAMHGMDSQGLYKQLKAKFPEIDAGYQCAKTRSGDRGSVYGLRKKATGQTCGGGSGTNQVVGTSGGSALGSA
jgi:hypothetical protein